MATLVQGMAGELRYPASTNALLRPFSRLSIPFFRRTSSNAPSTTSLQRLISLSEELKIGGELDNERGRKALGELGTYAKQVKERLSKDTLQDDQLHIDKLAEGYLRGFQLVCELRETRPSEDLDRAATDCLTGLVILASRLKGDIERMIQQSICQAVFASEEGALSPDPFLAPVFLQTRSLTSALLHGQLKRPIQSIQNSGDPTDHIVRSLCEADSEDQAIHHLYCLQLFNNLVAIYDPLPARPPPIGKETKAAAKAREDGDRDRPLRIVLEASIARCELATAMASTDISNVKVRSRGEVERESRINETATAGDSDSETSEVASESEIVVKAEFEQDDDDDVKPVVKEVQAWSDTQDQDEDDDEAGPLIPQEPAIQVNWEEQAESSLLSCLQQAYIAVKARRSKVITESIQPSDWYPTSRTANTAEQDSDASTESESDLNSLASDDDDDDNELTTHDPLARPPPLKTIFPLQDRYEELRLAVWLSLPSDSRGKMSAYMRGIPTSGEIRVMEESGMDPVELKARREGRIGKVWDDLGLALLKHFDG